MMLSGRPVRTPSRRSVHALTVLFLATACALPEQRPVTRQGEIEIGRVVSAPHGMVSSATEISTRIGAEILRAGGNAVDAAIATGFALAVTHPRAGNIGGGGFMVIRFPDGRSTVIDFREKAPLAAHPYMFEDPAARDRYSHLQVGVPGTVAGFEKAHRSYGRLSWQRLVEPAVAVARDGFEVPAPLARTLRSALRAEALGRYPASVAAFSKGGVPYEPGEIWRQPDLARTLGRIMRDGAHDFYHGETGRLIVAEMERGGGLITARDLALYEAVERAPVLGDYRGYDIISVSPPSGGGVALVQMLNILEAYDLAALGHNSSGYMHLLAEAMRRAYLDRARYLGDPEYTPVPLAYLTSKEYAAQLRRSIDLDRASASNAADAAAASLHLQFAESEETTHYSVVDADGLAVSVTYTLEQGYGSKVTVAGAGFLLNNEMGDFNARLGRTGPGAAIGTPPNLARPGQRPLSSQTPTILAKDGEVVAVIGSPGGRRIINTVLQVLINLVDFEMEPERAVAAARFHHQWLPDEIVVEAGAASPAALQALRQFGHTVQVTDGEQGRVHAVMIDGVRGHRIGVADRREAEGAAAGH